MTDLAYKFNPAGHEQPEERRKYAEPDKRLCKTFEKWLKRKDPERGDIERASEMLHDMLLDIICPHPIIYPHPAVEEAHALLLKYQEHPDFSEAGFFISAIYNNVPDKTIVYDLDMLTDGLAFRLDGKTFINNGTTGEHMGGGAKGIIINNGTASDIGANAEGIIINNGTTDVLGRYAKGIIINNGMAGYRMGFQAAGTIINNGTAGDEMGRLAKGYIINLGEAPGYHKENIPELKHYLDNLKTQLTNPNMEEVLRVLEGLTEARLSADITDMLKRAKWQQH